MAQLSSLTRPNSNISDAEPGFYQRRGSFQGGGIIETATSILYNESNKHWYKYNGSTQLPMKVAAGTVPDSNWEDVGDGSVAYLFQRFSDPDGYEKYKQLQISRWRDEGDVRGWGAIGDGVNDDTAAINAALQNAKGRVVFRNGTYLATDFLKIKSNTIVFIAPGATVKRNSGTLNSIFINDADGVTGGFNANSNIIITGGGTVDGNVSWLGNSCTLVSFGHCTNVTVENLKLINIGGRWHAIEFNAVFKGRALNLYIYGNGLPDDGAGEAIQIDQAGYAAKFPWFGPYDETACYDILIEGCRISGVGCAVGGHDPSGTSKHYDIKIVNNSFATSVYGIKTIGWSGVTIEGNRIERDSASSATAQAGIYCQYNTSGLSHGDIRIVNNTLFNWKPVNATSDVGNSFRGIVVDGDAADSDLNRLQNIIIANNVIYQTGGHGISLSWVQNVSVTSNYVEVPQNNSSSNRYSIYQANSKQFLLNDNNFLGDVFIGDGTVNPQTITGAGNFIGGNLTVNGNDTGGVNGNLTDNFVMGTRKLRMEHRLFLDSYADTISLSGTAAGNKGLYNNTDTRWIFRVDSSEVNYLGGHTVPNTTNAFTLGSSSFLWSTVYANSGTISTSDKNWKEDINELTDAEIRVAKACAKLYHTFKLKGGESGRTHVGTIAQLVAEEFEKEGLDPNNYGMYCFDEWDAVEEEKDEEGNVTTAAVEAGNRYAIRYDEFNSFVNAGMYHWLNDIESRLSLLETK